MLCALHAFFFWDRSNACFEDLNSRTDVKWIISSMVTVTMFDDSGMSAGEHDCLKVAHCYGLVEIRVFQVILILI